MLGFGDGTVLVDPVNPQVGSVEPLPVNGPVIDGVGIGGRDAPYLSAPGSQYFSAHALASLLFGEDKPGSVFTRIKRDYPSGSRAAFGFGNSAQSTNDFLYGVFPGGAANSPTFVKDAISEATKSITRAEPLDYDDHVVGFVTDGTTGWIYLDGAEVATGDLDTLSITPNRFVIGARVTTAALDFLGGWMSHFAMTSQVLSPAQAVEINNVWTSNDLGTPGKADGTKIQFFGDSITQGDSDNDPAIANNTRGGFRYRLYERFRSLRTRITMVGHNIQGIFANRQHSAQGGSDTNLVRQYINIRIPEFQPRAIFVMAGTNNTVAIENGSLPLATWRAQYDALLADARTQLDAYQSQGRIVVGNLTPIEPGQGGATVVASMNTQIAAAVAAANAANPTKPPIILCDFHTAIGPWSMTNFKDAAHPNFSGYTLLGDELWNQAGAYFLSIAA